MAKSKGIVTSAKLASLASKVLKGYEPTREEILALAASALRQREAEKKAKKEAKEVEAAAVVEEVAEEEPVPETEAVVVTKEDVTVVVESPTPMQQQSSWLGRFFNR